MEKLTAQERMFEIVGILVEHHTEGMSNKELSGVLQTTEATISRDMSVFEKYGWITRSNGGRLRLSPEFGSLAGKIIKNYQKAKLELTKAEAEYLSAME
ncbi:MAG: hypothetical protein P1P59_07590 [Treponemataceae bacterium]